MNPKKYPIFSVTDKIREKIVFFGFGTEPKTLFFRVQMYEYDYMMLFDGNGV